MSLDLVHYADLLGQIKQRIRQGQARAVLSANAEMITTYWDVGRILHERQQQEGWGRAIIPRLAKDIHNELPEIKGFSERNIERNYETMGTLLSIYLLTHSPAVVHFAHATFSKTRHCRASSARYCARNRTARYFQ